MIILVISLLINYPGGDDNMQDTKNIHVSLLTPALHTGHLYYSMYRDNHCIVLCEKTENWPSSYVLCNSMKYISFIK